MVYVFLADGFEEIEALTPVDVLRRSNIDVKTVGVYEKDVLGSHNIEIKADILLEDVNIEVIDGIILPGGMPGTKNLEKSEKLCKIIKYCMDNNILTAAICAAPSILGKPGYLDGRDAICYPGFEKELKGANIIPCDSGVSGNVITGRGPGAVFEFSKNIVDYLKNEKDTGKSILEGMQYFK